MAGPSLVVPENSAYLQVLRTEPASSDDGAQYGDAQALSALAPAESVQLLRFDEAAARLGVSRRTVERMVASGELPYVSIRGFKRIALEDIAGFINSQRQTVRPVRRRR